MKKGMKLTLVVLAIAMILVMAFTFTACNKANYEKLRENGGTTDGKSIDENTDTSTIVSQKVDEEGWSFALNNIVPTTVTQSSDGEESQSFLTSMSFKEETSYEVNAGDEYKMTQNITSIMKVSETACYILCSGAFSVTEGEEESNEEEIYMEVYMEFSKTSGQTIYIRNSKDATWTKSFASSVTPQTLAAAVTNAVSADFSVFSYDESRNAYVGTATEGGICDQINKLLPSDNKIAIDWEVKIVNNYMSSVIGQGSLEVTDEESGITGTVSFSDKIIVYGQNTTTVTTPAGIVSDTATEGQD